MNSRTKADRIITFEAISSRRASSFATSAMRHEDWAPGRMLDAQNQTYQDSAFQNSEWAPLSVIPALELAWKMEVIPNALEVARFYYGVSELETTDVGIVRYKPGGFYKPHRDSSLDSITSRRVLTVVLYLNSRFTGGRTLFPELDHFERPTSGTCVMFLSSLLHSGEALKTGSKIAVVGWLSKPLAASPEAKIKPSVAKGSKARERVALHRSKL
jgi:Rps23 Pro-64 3,4-dihydroxylase Tpa1-like proline 4-hydroxylase